MFGRVQPPYVIPAHAGIQWTFREGNELEHKTTAGNKTTGNNGVLPSSKTKINIKFFSMSDNAPARRKERQGKINFIRNLSNLVVYWKESLDKFIGTRILRTSEAGREYSVPRDDWLRAGRMRPAAHPISFLPVAAKRKGRDCSLRGDDAFLPGLG